MNSIPPGDVEAIQNWAASIPVIKRVWIFGSRARGTARPSSDLDIAVEHDTLRGDSNAFTTVIGEAENWRHIQTRVGLTVDLESYLLGITQTIEAALNESSVLFMKG